MKGISPLIATVLLIAFTIGVGGLVSLFATSLTTTTTGITSNSSESLTKCAGAWLEVRRVTNSTIVFSNPNRETVTAVQVIFTNGNNQTATDQILSPGETGALTLNGGLISSSNVVTANTTVTVRGQCQATTLAEGVCKQGQACWEAS